MSGRLNADRTSAESFGLSPVASPLRPPGGSLDRYSGETHHAGCRHFGACDSRRPGTQRMPSYPKIRLFRSRGSLCLWTALLTVGLGAAARAVPLPFSVNAWEVGRWIPMAVGKKVTGNIRLEAIIVHREAPDRFVVLSAPATDDKAISLRDFARRLPGLFTDFRRTLGTEAKAKKMGFSGYDLHFELHRNQQVVIGELFVFADAQRWWGVMYARPAQVPASPVPVFNLLHRRVAPPPGVVAMAPYHVKKQPLTSFPISLDIREDPRTGRVAGIVVTDVPPGSMTQRAGVKVGDAIVAVNGRKTVDFPAGIGKGSALGRIFLNRSPGDEVNLEIKPAAGGKPFRVTLRVPGGWSEDNPFGFYPRRR